MRQVGRSRETDIGSEETVRERKIIDMDRAKLRKSFAKRDSQKVSF